ncbi:hypothetical protein M8745_16675 [Lutimaribacter sp. EGI FJ00014]|nr:hypothetical protein [Lutimaribacter sp. EGI FJ00014]
MEAKTIHRLLEFDPTAFRFKRNDENPLDCDLVVNDESSVIGVAIAIAPEGGDERGGNADRGRHRPVTGSALERGCVSH